MYYLCSENKGSDQLCGDLHLCFGICKNNRFSHDAAHFTNGHIGVLGHCLPVTLCWMDVQADVDLHLLHMAKRMWRKLTFVLKNKFIYLN